MNITSSLNAKLEQIHVQLETQKKRKEKSENQFEHDFKLSYKEAVHEIANHIAQEVIKEAKQIRKQTKRYYFTHDDIHNEQHGSFISDILHDKEKFKNTPFDPGHRYASYLVMKERLLHLQPKIVKHIHKLLQSATHENVTLDYTIVCSSYKHGSEFKHHNKHKKNHYLYVDFVIREKNIFEKMFG